MKSDADKKMPLVNAKNPAMTYGTFSNSSTSLVPGVYYVKIKDTVQLLNSVAIKNLLKDHQKIEKELAKQADNLSRQYSWESSKLGVAMLSLGSIISGSSVGLFTVKSEVKELVGLSEQVAKAQEVLAEHKLANPEVLRRRNSL